MVSLHSPQLASAGQHCLAIDLPGLGHSSPLPAGLAYHDLEMVAVLYRVLGVLGWHRVSLVSSQLLLLILVLLLLTRWATAWEVVCAFY